MRRLAAYKDGTFAEIFTMRFLFGIVVGIVLTLGLAWLHDTGTLRFGPEQAFVNWDAVMGLTQ